MEISISPLEIQPHEKRHWLSNLILGHTFHEEYARLYNELLDVFKDIAALICIDGIEALKIESGFSTTRDALRILKDPKIQAISMADIGATRTLINLVQELRAVTNGSALEKIQSSLDRIEIELKKLERKLYSKKII